MHFGDNLHRRIAVYRPHDYIRRRSGFRPHDTERNLSVEQTLNARPLSRLTTRRVRWAI